MRILPYRLMIKNICNVFQNNLVFALIQIEFDRAFDFSAVREHHNMFTLQIFHRKFLTVRHFKFPFDLTIINPLVNLNSRVQKWNEYIFKPSCVFSNHV